MEKSKLFILPFAGGSRYSLKFLEKELDKTFELFFLELPGRGSRVNEPLLKNINSVIKDYYNQITSFDLSGELFFYGHSMGAILALRLAEKLESDKFIVNKVFVSGCCRLEPDHSKKVFEFEKSDLKAELKEMGGMPNEALYDNSFFDFFEPIIRADFEVIQAVPFFNKSFRVKAPIFSMMGSRESEVSKIKNWEKLTSSGFEYAIFEGGHFFIYENAHSIVNIIISK